MSSSSNQLPPLTLRTVSISYSDLRDRNADLSAKIEQGFGPNGLGILSVSEVPGYSLWRKNLLQLGPRLANLPEDVKMKLEDPNSRYNFGWSHGKEKLESGKLDLLKGSFYANPILDVPTTEQSLIERYPSYCGSNIWPRNVLPELETAFKTLGKLILDVGLLLAYHCDRYAMLEGTDCGLERTLVRSRCHKGRLLYYFPAQHGQQTSAACDSMSSWCGWHTDHGSLTGLTRGMFSRNGVGVVCPDSAAGLYIRTRTGEIVKVEYGEDEIAYQIGETTEILSSGRLCATPHCVRAPEGEGDAAVGVDRTTFALFMQPDWDQKLNFPEEVHIHRELIQSNGSLTFGEYTEKLLDKYYHLKI
ncbi:uncharacterized protein LOC107762470 [Nicotiana tabacum]|uniref:Uncharacterized protein LOC107762470 n=1 Tax=Nicotiana tabacum TaxID=4097 RepID=A0A1S3X976_TOBAC|nr:PREDICTED: uncharacterized protein LOC107762470 [Nicotiana tabacum]XP_033510144.1 uncharacterized protein LOC104089121 [Nicotiana tomentosiformis]